MLVIENVSRQYNDRSTRVDALSDVSLQVPPGRFELIKGHSGSGKTTLLLIAGGMSRPSSGTVLIDGVDIYRLGPGTRARLRADKIGYLFQSPNLVPYLDAIDNVTLSAPRPTAVVRDRAVALLESFGLADRMKHRPGQLSQGEKQRVALARAALNQPAVLLADEPTGNLDQRSAEVVFQALRAMADAGTAVLTVTHADTPDGLADRVYRLSSARLLSDSPETVLTP